MADTQTIFIGDDVFLQYTVGTEDENGIFTAKTIPLSATIKASLISRNETILIDSISQVSSTPNADWANGVVVVHFTNVQTNLLSFQKNAFVEVEIDDSGTISTFQSEPNIIIKRTYIT